jgi:hypothetical protein
MHSDMINVRILNIALMKIRQFASCPCRGTRTREPRQLPATVSGIKVSKWVIALRHSGARDPDEPRLHDHSERREPVPVQTTGRERIRRIIEQNKPERIREHVPVLKSHTTSIGSRWCEKNEQESTWRIVNLSCWRRGFRIRRCGRVSKDIIPVHSKPRNVFTYSWPVPER